MYIKLNDGTEITIEDGASLENLTHICESEEAAIDICSKLTDENAAHIEFFSDGEAEPFGTYDDLVTAHAPYRFDNEDGTVTVSFAFRTKTYVEKMLDKIAEEQDMQNEAINMLLMM